MVEIHKGIGRPEFLPELFSGNHFSGSLEQSGKHSKRLVLEPKSAALLSKFARFEIGFKDAETGDSGFLADLRRRSRHAG
jgi:hypothetical protein